MTGVFRTDACTPSHGRNAQTRLYSYASEQGALCSDGHLRQEPHGTLCCPYFALVLAGGQLVVLLHHVHAKKRLQKTSAL